MSKLIKHSAAIQLAGPLSIAQRQCYNALLKNAFPWLERGEDHWILVRDLAGLLRKKTTNNRAWLIETAESLRDVPVRYNVFAKDRENQGIWEMHSGLLAEIGVKANREMLKYSFPNTLVDLLRDPSMYAKINLDFQARFRGHYGLPLYEFYLDMLGGKRTSTEFTFWVEDLRRLLCLENSHKEFKHLQAKVIKPAHREINTHTDINVTVVEQLREARSVVALKLHIERTGLVQPHIQAEKVAAAAPDVQRALEVYYSRDTVALVLNRYSAQYIRAQLEYLERQKARQTIRDPAAYLRACLQKDHARHAEGTNAVIVENGGGQPEHSEQTAGPSPEERRARELKEMEGRWEAHCAEVRAARYEECDQEEKAALQVRFEHSDLYRTNHELLRGRGQSGIYRRLFATFLLQELCPEPRFHDFDAFVAWQESQPEAESADAVVPAGE